MKQEWDGSRHAERRTEQLMPLEAAAKAIFIRANGLVAYQDATGKGRRAEDARPAHGEGAATAGEPGDGETGE